jgi:dTDP-glucose 4,6-dehydratase
MSSCSVYGQTTESITELTPVNPKNPYGFSKACAELVAKCYANNYGIRTLIFRPSHICGEGQREMNALREFVTCAKNGMPLLLFGEGEHVREWLHPIDVADAITRGISYFDQMTNPYEVFVLGSKPVSMKDLAHLVVSKTNRGKVVHVQRGSQTFDQYTNSEKMARVLGWTATIPVEEIVSRVAMQDLFVN